MNDLQCKMSEFVTPEQPFYFCLKKIKKVPRMHVGSYEIIFLIFHEQLKPLLSES